MELRKMIPNFKISKEKQYRLDLVVDIIKDNTKNINNIDNIDNKSNTNGSNNKPKFIDLGCKDGYLLDKTKELGYEVHGVDISFNAVNILSKQGYSMKKLDLGKELSYPDDCFDIVSCQQVIEHLTNPEHLIKEMHRILKPGGILILSTPNLASLGSRLRLLFNKYPLQLGPCNEWHFGNHYRLFTIPTLKTVLERNKLKIEQIIGTEIYFNPNSWKKGLHSTKLAKLFPSLAQRVIVVCRKQ